MSDEKPESATARLVATRTVAVFDAVTDRPVEGVQIARVAANGTRLMGKTSGDGAWMFSEHYPGAVTLMAAAPSWSGGTKFLQPHEWEVPVRIPVEPLSDGGSVIFANGTGVIPHLEGRLNPIRDAQKRYYLYGDNISFENSPDQPFNFSIDKPFVAEDAYGSQVRITVLAIVGRTSLIRYRAI